MRIKQTAVNARLLRANLVWMAAGCLLGTSPGVTAQETGVSVPQPVLSDSSDSATTVTKPSAAIPLGSSAPASTVVYGPYVPYHAPGTADSPVSTTPGSSQPFDPDASIVTEESIHRRKPLSPEEKPTDDVDARIVTRVPTRPGELSEGTLLQARLQETISTLRTEPGTAFTALLSAPVMQNNQVYIPEGSVVQGRVTSLHGGARIGGGASIHLEPQRITLPDGTSYSLDARVIDTSSWENTKVDEEGTIVRREHLKGALETGGLVTGSAIATGAVVGGVPGALIGAGVGVGATAVVWLRQDRQAELPKNLGIVFSLTAPMTLAPAQARLPGALNTSRLPGE